ncbi:MAG TPA: AAA family ATPase, partial [Acidimicrobiales bacterium]|nr:AAA family ATPase [Acidimicrobiales bacterium]
MSDDTRDVHHRSVPTAVETLTVLFTDLAGSTSLRVERGEERADELRSIHDDLVARSIRSNGGRVVKHTGDGAMAVFGGASDAIAAAVTIQQAIDRLNHERGESLGVRIGISAGDVSVEGDDCFGLPVVEAQRLEAAAAPGQIFCSALVRLLARGRGGHELRPVGAMALKGLDGPIDVDEVGWAPARGAGPATLPPGLERDATTELAGRTVERDAIAAQWDAVRSGATRVVLLAGEPGIGKSTLAAAAAVDVVASGGTVLFGRCDELVPAPYQPFAEALRWHVQSGRTSVEIERWRGDLARLVPSLGAVTSLGDVAAERQLLFEAVGAWLASSGPALLVLDDLHWADAGTVLLLRHLVVTAPVPKLLIVGTYRDTDLDRRHPLADALGELFRRADVTRSTLRGLSVEDVQGVVARSGLAASDAVALHEQTAGNPFFLGEMVRHLDESRARDNGDGDGERLPEGVREVVGRRVSHLGEDAQRALTAAAVVGHDVALDVLATVTELGEDATVDALDNAVAAGLLTERAVGAYRFAHAVVRTTLYDELSATRRARLHRRVAEVLEVRHGDDPASAGALAHHWSSAGGGDAADRAVHFASIAAVHAFRALGIDESIAWYDLALEVLDAERSTRTVELARHRADVAAAVSHRTHRQLVYDAARRARALGDVAALTRALCVSGRTGFAHELEPPDPEKVALLEEALALVPDGEHELRARLLAELSVELIYTDEHQRRFTAIDEGRAAVAHVRDPAESAQLHFRLGLGRRFLTFTSADVRRDVAAMLAGEPPLGRDVGRDIGVTTHRFLLQLAIGDRAGADDAAARLTELASVTRHPQAERTRQMTQAVLDVVAGRIESLEATVAEMQSGRVSGAEQYAMGLVMQIDRERRGFASVVDAIQPMVRAATAPTDLVLGVAAVGLADAGRIEEAHAIVDAAAATTFAQLPDDAMVPVHLATWSEAAARTGHRGAASTLRALLLVDPELHLVTGGFYAGSRKHHLALLAAALG